MMQQISDWLTSTPVSEALAGADWFVPAAQTVHILAIAAVLALLATLNARLLGLTTLAPPPPRLAAACLPGFWGALTVLLFSGSLLVIAEPARELMNPAFRVKIPLVLVLAVLTLLLQRGLLRHRWGETRHGRRLAGGIAVASTLLCVAIVAAGRLIAYA
jgi:hypothetical protein